MRINFRTNFRNITSYSMLSDTQTIEGVTSLQSDGKHIIMWDLDDCDLEEATLALRRIQREFSLSNIYIFSDAKGSYRAWCFNHVSFWTYIHILTSMPEKMIDYNFLWWTVERGKATLRTSNKQGRPPQKLVRVLESYPHPIPKVMEKATYDTGVDREGINILLDVLTDDHVFRLTLGKRTLELGGER